MSQKVLRTYASAPYCLDDFRGVFPEGHIFTRQEIVQYALGEALEHYGMHLRREVGRHNSVPITGLRLEIDEQGIDIQVAYT